MKSRDNAIQFKSHARTSAFNSSGSKCFEKGFDTPPFQCGGDGRFEDVV